MRKFKKIMSGVVVWVFVALAVLPILYVVMMAFKPDELANRLPPVWLHKPSLDAFVSVFMEHGLLKYLTNSIIVSGVVLTISMFVGSLAAYSLARYKVGGKTMTYMILVVQMVPPMVITFPLFIFIQKLGLIDSRTGLIMAQLTFTLPFIIWVMRQFFIQIPRSIDESAALDGASKFRTFFQIMMPMSKAGLVSAGIFTFFNSWNDFLYPLVLSVSKAQTVTIAASNFVTIYDVLWSKISAVCTVIMIPPIILTIFMRKHIVNGLVGDATKG